MPIQPARHSEAAFETIIEDHLLRHGYIHVMPTFDVERAIFPKEVLHFIQATQPKEWAKLEALHGDNTEKQVITDLCKWMDSYGSLHTLRHGFKCYGRNLRIAIFKAAHRLNPELEAQYEANRLGVMRQLHYSSHNTNSLDMTLVLNGIPVATLELKNPLTGQTAEHAKHQYQHDRDSREVIFEFKRRTLVHFAVDTEQVWMITRLAGKATRFLPFNKGTQGGAGNPPDPHGRTYRTAYLWEEVLDRDSFLDLLAAFLHLQTEERRDEDGRKYKKETMIFPRYHQLQAVRKLTYAAREDGVGHNYLIEHSAGSGKSNTIGWVAHRLASLHNQQDEHVFDSVVVITDRRILDQQLQDTIYQFEHKHGVVQKIDEDSRQLAEALENAVPIIITTLQKFPFVSKQLVKMAEERHEQGKGLLPTRHLAVIVDEAHSSQSGEASTELKGVLGGEKLLESAQERAREEGMEHLEELFREMAKRSRQANLSFFAFTATPKHKTLKIFGHNGEPFHRYTMRQAIEEGFIMDVLRNYTTYKVFYRLIKSSENDPNVERKKAAQALARFMRLHPYNIAQKTEIMVEHFYAFTRHKIGGKAKAMVVTGSRLEAVRYKQAFDEYIRQKGYPIKTLVAFSGIVQDDKLPDKTYTEEGMNNGIKERELTDRFATTEYQVLLVAEKYQMGFDQPLLHTMYVDKRLSGIQAVQTLSRLNRIHPLKEDTFILDFFNEPDEIREAFKQFYEGAEIGEEAELKRYDLILGQTLFVEIEDLDERVLYEFDEIKERQEKRKISLPIADFKLANRYDDLRLGSMVSQSEMLRDGLIDADGNILRSGLTKKQSQSLEFLTQLNQYDALLDKMRLQYPEISFTDLCENEYWFPQIAQIFSKQPDAKGKYQSRFLKDLFRRIDMFPTEREGELTPTYQGIWYDGNHRFIVGDVNSLKLTGQAKAHLVRQFITYQGKGKLELDTLLDATSVRFVRLNQFTVYPYFYHLIDLYIENVLQYVSMA